MRKITENMVSAFFDNDNTSQGNTTVATDDTGTSMFLHGNEIAKLENGVLSVNFCGYPTTTTKERINGICEKYINARPFHSIAFELHRNGQPCPDNQWLIIPNVWITY